MYTKAFVNVITNLDRMNDFLVKLFIQNYGWQFSLTFQFARE